MTIPLEYARASEVFDRLIEDARIRLGHATRHQTYQTVESVLRVFRRRLSVQEAVAFAATLPAVLRAVFLTDWDTGAPVLPFSDRAAMTEEVRNFRKDHDFSPDGSIAVIASVVVNYVDPIGFDRVLSSLPAGARQFWRGSDGSERQ